MELFTEHERNDERLALARLSLAWLTAVGLQTSPPDWLLRETLVLVPEMPFDIPSELADHPPYQWLRFVSAHDFCGNADAALVLLDRIDACARELPPSLEQQDILALVCARRARLARQFGEVESAEDWYRRGLARSRGDRHGVAWASCVQGLANCAQHRGDDAAAERLSRLVCLNHRTVPEYAHVGALLTLAVLYRRNGRVAAAMRCAWRVHDLVPERDERRGSALVELSQLALARLELGAARRGFDVVLSFTQTTRVRRPAQSGALAVAVITWRSSPSAKHRQAVEQRADILLAESHDCAQPWERVHARLDVLEAMSLIGQTRKADVLAVALDLELTACAAVGGRMLWAEQRLQRWHAGALVPPPATKLDTPLAPERARVERESIARLAALEAIHVNG